MACIYQRDLSTHVGTLPSCGALRRCVRRLDLAGCFFVWHAPKLESLSVGSAIIVPNSGSEASAESRIGK